MRVLIVEDSDAIRQSVAQALREAGLAVDAIADGPRGLAHARTSDYDAIVLDIGLPGLDGLAILKTLRDKGNCAPVLLLTARDAIDDRVRGLQSGADDYLVKPFALAELLARVRALIRRSKGIASQTLRVGPLAIDANAKTVRVSDGPSLELPPREYALLEYLAHRAGMPVSRLELEEHLYDGISQVQSNAVDSAVCSLRARLDAAGCPSMIRTRRKLGYVLEPVGGGARP